MAGRQGKQVEENTRRISPKCQAIVIPWAAGRRSMAAGHHERTHRIPKSSLLLLAAAVTHLPRKIQEKLIYWCSHPESAGGAAAGRRARGGRPCVTCTAPWLRMTSYTSLVSRKSTSTARWGRIRRIPLAKMKCLLISRLSLEISEDLATCFFSLIIR
jgi:hypothetical protein